MVREEVDHDLHPRTMNSAHERLELRHAQGWVHGVVGADIAVITDGVEGAAHDRSSRWACCALVGCLNAGRGARRGPDELDADRAGRVELRDFADGESAELQVAQRDVDRSSLDPCPQEAQDGGGMKMVSSWALLSSSLRA